MISEDLSIGVIGLGYVGLPLAVEFGKSRSVVAFDLDAERIAQLTSGFDRTLEVTASDLAAAQHVQYTANFSELRHVNCYIITVPTPLDENKAPDLSNLISASKLVGEVLKKGDIVIYESTVYPGCTEEVCSPVLEDVSGLKYNQDFFCGYSPERVNPGDKARKLTNIIKVTAGSTPEVSRIVDDLYKTIITAGTHKTDSIRIAEAAKIIENTQRDLNIALINELAIIFEIMGVETEAVLEAAGTKWNFLPFRPGLVGGHCIGVDPYYLTHKAEAIGYTPELILAGRRLNDGMGGYVASKLVKGMRTRSIPVENSNVLIMGLAFKENCTDIRNTRVIDVINDLQGRKCNVDVFDPWVSPEDSLRQYKLETIHTPKKYFYDAIIIAVGHDRFKKMSASTIRSFGKGNHLLYDLKYIFDVDQSDMRL